MVWECVADINQVGGPCAEGNTLYATYGSLNEERCVVQRPEKKDKYRLETDMLTKKVKFVVKTKLRYHFERAPSNISVMPMHLVRSWGSLAQ